MRMVQQAAVQARYEPLHAFPTTATMLLPGLLEALLGHLGLRLLLQLRVEFLHHPVEALYLLGLKLAPIYPRCSPSGASFAAKLSAALMITTET